MLTLRSSLAGSPSLTESPDPSAADPIRRLLAADPAITTFEVNDYDTLAQSGVDEPEIHADLYPDIDPAAIRSGQDAVGLLYAHVGLEAQLTVWIAGQLDDLEARLDDVPPSCRFTLATRDLVRRRDEWVAALGDWEAWLRALPPDRLEPIRALVAAWLEEPIDGSCCEVPMYAGPQGQALEFFEALPLETLEELGVELVYGDRPGSSYFAAELKADPDEATAVAFRLGLDIRFVREGQTLDDGPESPPELSTPEAGSCRGDRFLQDFRPLFGVQPEAAWLAQAARSSTVPPRSLRHLHFDGLFESAWTRVVDCVKAPVQVRPDADGGRHVQVLAVAVYSFAGDGTVRGHLWRTNPELNPVLEACDPGALTVDGTPLRWRWMQHVLGGFGFEVACCAKRQGQTVEPVVLQRYIEWAFQVFRNRIQRGRDGCDLRAMRRQIAHALDVDALLLQVARQLCLTDRLQRATMGVYNRAVRHQAAHRKLTQDAPGLHLAYALLCHEDDAVVGLEPETDEPLQRLRRRVKAHGLSQRLWRLLLGSASRLWRPMERFYQRCDADAAWDYLRLVDMLGWRAGPDPMFMQLLLAQVGSSHRRRSAYSACYEGEERALRAVVQRFEACDASGRAAMLVELPQVLTWLGKSSAKPALQAARAPAWSTLVRRANQYAADRLRLAQQAHQDWVCPAIKGQEHLDADLEVVVLASAQALHEEGSAMRHCALSYAADCVGGRALVASIRVRRSGKRVATVLWVRKQAGWVVSEVVGFANGPAPARVVMAAQRLQVAKAEIGRVSEGG